MISININNKATKECKKCKHCYEFDRYGGDMPSTLHCTNTKFCFELSELEKIENFPKQTIIYLHSNKESMREEGQKLGLSEDAIDNKFQGCLYELAVHIEVNIDGSYKILMVDG